MSFNKENSEFCTDKNIKLETDQYKEVSEELKELLKPKEDIYNRELNFSGIFENEEDEYDEEVSKELRPYLLPILKEYLKI